MKKFWTAFVFSVLIMALVAEIGLFAYIYLKDRKREEAKTAAEEMFNGQQPEEAGMPDEAEEESLVETGIGEASYCVLVAELPVYAENDISANTENEPLEVLERGGLVEMVREGTPYSLIQYGEASQGYVWSDCIRAEMECDEYTATRNVVVIDAGHQEKGNLETEPIGPGETEMKEKTSDGSQGASTKVPESELDLAIALLLEEKLKDRYTVVMVRRTQDVTISNKERAMLANDIKADAFVRIHANGIESPQEANGALTICNTENSKYDDVRENYEVNKKLASCILDAYTEATGFNKREIMEKDTYSGINWSKVPVTIVEMGFMTNPSEDEKMQDPEFQQKMAQGIADGIDDFFGSLQIE